MVKSPPAIGRMHHVVEETLWRVRHLCCDRLAGFKAEAQTQGAQSGGITRTHMGMVRLRQSVSDGHDDNLHGQCGSKV